LVLVLEQTGSLEALQAIVRKEQGYIDQASSGLLIAFGSKKAAEAMRQIEGVLSVQFVVSFGASFFVSLNMHHMYI
jgi:hypothetical protein